jgi:hypothetical protein
MMTRDRDGCWTLTGCNGRTRPKRPKSSPCFCLTTISTIRVMHLLSFPNMDEFALYSLPRWSVMSCQTLFRLHRLRFVLLVPKSANEKRIRSRLSPLFYLFPSRKEVQLSPSTFTRRIPSTICRRISPLGCLRTALLPRHLNISQQPLGFFLCYLLRVGCRRGGANEAVFQVGLS